VSCLSTTQHASSRGSIGKLEISVAVFITAIYACDILRLVFNADDGEAAGDTFRAFALTVYVVTAAMLAPHARAAFQAAGRSPVITLLVLLPVISLTWSANPSATLVRSIMLVGSSLFGFYLAVRLPARVLLRVYAMAAFGVALLSLFLIFLVPSIGIEQKEPWVGAWNGAYLHKNGLGGNMALNAGLITLYLFDKEARRAWWPFAALGACLFLLFGSQSVTGQVTYVVSVAAIITIRSFLGLLRSVVLPAMIVLLPLMLVPLAFLDGNTFGEILESLGRDVTLSGRIPLWNAVWPFIENRFWLGYGYEAFWSATSDAMRVIEQQAKFRAFYSHNGMLELMLAVGAIGAAIFLFSLFQFIGRMVRVIGRFPMEMFSSMVAIFTFTFILRNISEVAILTRHDMAWCMFIALSLKLATAVAAMREAAAPVRPGPGPAMPQHRAPRPPAPVMLPQGRTA
jgi:exopolysaccharide production protein ExoQ